MNKATKLTILILIVAIALKGIVENYFARQAKNNIENLTTDELNDLFIRKYLVLGVITIIAPIVLFLMLRKLVIGRFWLRIILSVFVLVMLFIVNRFL